MFTQQDPDVLAQRSVAAYLPVFGDLFAHWKMP